MPRCLVLTIASQAGDDRVLQIEAKVQVIKARRQLERQLGVHRSTQSP